MNSTLCCSPKPNPPSFFPTLSTPLSSRRSVCGALVYAGWVVAGGAGRGEQAFTATCNGEITKASLGDLQMLAGQGKVWDLIITQHKQQKNLIKVLHFSATSDLSLNCELLLIHTMVTKPLGDLFFS